MRRESAQNTDFPVQFRDFKEFGVSKLSSRTRRLGNFQLRQVWEVKFMKILVCDDRPVCWRASKQQRGLLCPPTKMDGAQCGNTGGVHLIS